MKLRSNELILTTALFVLMFSCSNILVFASTSREGTSFAVSDYFNEMRNFLLGLVLILLVAGNNGAGTQDNQDTIPKESPAEQTSPKAGTTVEPPLELNEEAIEDLTSADVENTSTFQQSTNLEESPPAVEDNMETIPESQTPTEIPPESPSTNEGASQDLPFHLHKSMFETAKTVSLAPLDTPTKYEQGRLSLVAHIPFNYRKKICTAILAYVSPKNADFLNYIFDAHLYEFEFPDKETSYSIAIQCPTKSYPRVFLRIPTTISDVRVVIVPNENVSSQRYIYSLATAISIVPFSGENSMVSDIRKSPIFGFGATELEEMCEGAQKRFKYGLVTSLFSLGRKVIAPAIYEVRFRDTKEFYGAIKCPATPTMHLLFTNSNREIKVIFLAGIQNWIENGITSLKSKLMSIFPST